MLEEAFQPYRIGDRSASTAMLAWFLLNVERLDPEQVNEALCDGGGDKGIDAVVVDDDLSEITIYQSKHMDSVRKTQGDRDLKNLLGAARYFVNKDTVAGLLASKPNLALRNLLQRNKVEQKIAAGYRVRRLVYVTNSVLDASGAGLATAMADQDPPLDVWHKDRLAAVADRVKRSDMRPETVHLEAANQPIVNDLGDARLAIALIAASELVANLPGIDDLTLFSRNVRLSAGNTRINKELAATVANKDEHLLFPASHNGITVLTLGLETDGAQLQLTAASVVNGCQSLLALYRGRSQLTPELRLVVKIIELPAATSTLSDTITYRANNQNAVNIRDQRSTDRIQLDLQRQVSERYGDLFSYSIKVGERSRSTWKLDNTLAAQLIMAAVRAKPWAAVRKIRLFDQDYHDVFASDINADKLFLLRLISEAADDARGDLNNELRSSFASIRFTLVALLADLVRQSPAGVQLMDEPGSILPANTDRVLSFLSDRARDLALSINGYVSDAAAEAADTGTDFDPKTVFMSSVGVAPLKREILVMARRLNRLTPGFLFTLDDED